MKKSAKIVILFLSIALVFGAFALATGASNTVVDYTTENGIETTDSLDTAFENVAEGGTVTLKSKVSIRESIKISKSVTVNLNGNTIASNANVPVFEVNSADGSEIVVNIVGSGYIYSESGILNQKSDAEVNFIGEKYGIHMQVSNIDATAIAVSAGKVYLENVRVVMSNRAPSAPFVNVSGGELSGKNFGIVSEAEDGSLAYAVAISGDGCVNLDNCYIDVTSSIFYVADGTSGKVTVNDDVAEEVVPDEDVTEGLSDEITEEDPDAMPEAPVREELVAFEDGGMNPVLVVNECNLVQRIVSKKSYAVTFVAVQGLLKNGVSGAMTFTDSKLVFANCFINTDFGKDTTDEAL